MPLAPLPSMMLTTAAANLEAACVLEIKRRVHRIQRRCKSADPGLAPIDVLLRKLANATHLMTRLQGCKEFWGLEPCSSEWLWSGVVLNHFVAFLQARPTIFQVRELAKEDSKNCHCKLGVVLVEVATISSNFSTEELKTVHERLKVVLMEGGLGMPNSTGMNVGRVCEDAKLSDLLQGRRLVDAVISMGTDCGFQVYKDEKRGGYWYVKGDEDRNGIDVDMQADDEGRFSMTGARPAAVMAKRLGSYFEEVTSSAPSSGICFDLTAGIGGDTIALANVFGKVYAYEIAESRYALLEQNVRKKNVQHVEIICADCTRELENIRKTTLGSSILPAAFVDPPWGGVHYKRYLVTLQNCMYSILLIRL